MRHFAVILVLVFNISLTQAAEPVSINNAWARASKPGQTVGAAYMQLKSRAQTTLISVESTAADSIEIHQMSMDKGVMKMRMLETLPLAAGKVVKLEPGGFHLMLFDLKMPLKTGALIPLTLHFKDGSGKTSDLSISIPVKEATE